MRVRALLFERPSPALGDTAQLVIRVCFAASLFAIHGWEKLSGFQSMIDRYHMDPLHIGVYPSLLFATLSDGICTILVIMGLGTRAASTVITINLAVVYFVMQDALGIFARFDQSNLMLRAPRGEHTELTFLYLVFFAYLLITGPGRYSLDYFFSRRLVSYPGPDRIA